MTFGSARSAIPFTLLLASGCLFGGPQPGKSGELGNDRFQYACVVDTDGMCDDQAGTFNQEPIYGLPVIALGSKFGLDTDGVTTEARSVNDFVDEGETNSKGIRELTAKKAGWAAVGSFTFDQQPVDLVHIFIVEPVASKLFTRSSDGKVWTDAGAQAKLSPGSPLELRVAPTDDKGQLLAGGLDVTWTATPANIVKLSPSSDDNVTTVEPLKDGIVTITAKIGSFTNTVSVTVSGEMGTGGGGGQGGQGGGGGAGTTSSSSQSSGQGGSGGGNGQ